MAIQELTQEKILLPPQLGTRPFRLPREKWYAAAHTRLSQALALAPRISFTDDSRIIFFSDLHRGDNGRADAFLPNKALFLHALERYYEEGFTYIEVGDGDELWHSADLGAVQRAHGRVFELLHAFNDDERLHLIVGNHDTGPRLFDPVEKDGIEVHHGLILEHARTRQRLFAVHGHQAGQGDDRHWWFGRLFARHIWRPMLAAGCLAFYHVTEPERDKHEPAHLYRMPRPMSKWILDKPRRLEACIKAWIKDNHLITICGHTHLPAFPAAGEPPYFNTGNGVSPGYLTGLEIQNGLIGLIKWTANAGAYTRQVLRVTPLSSLAHV